MLKVAGRLMTTMGIALLFMALVMRIAPMSAASRVGDDLAIIASAAVLLIGVIATRRMR
jgi:hypothetical protein